MDYKGKTDGMLPIGSTLQMGKYRIESYLGSGGFGNTYKATHQLLGEVVAIKEFYIRGISSRKDNTSCVSVSNADNKDTFEVQREKLKKEARRLRMLSNRHIIRVSDLFEENGTVYYVMDYIDGCSLFDYLGNRGSLSEDKVWKYLNHILDALEEAHRNHIFHLDVKPENIMIDKDDNAVLIDFGASKQIRPGAKGVEKTQIAYTNGYAAMELMEKNEEKIGPWTDLYSLGATVFSLLTDNKPPMPSDIYGSIALASKGGLLSPEEQCHAAFPQLDHCSEQMRYLVYWLMQTVAVVRPQTVSEVRKWIQQNVNAENNPSTVADHQPTSIPRPQQAAPLTDEKTQLHNPGAGSQSGSDFSDSASRQMEATMLFDTQHNAKSAVSQKPDSSVSNDDYEDESSDENSEESDWKRRVKLFLLGFAIVVALSLVYMFFPKGRNLLKGHSGAINDSIAENFEMALEYNGEKPGNPALILYSGTVDRNGNPHGMGEAIFIDEDGKKTGMSYSGRFFHGMIVIHNDVLGDYKYYGALDNQGRPHAVRGRAEFINENNNPDGRSYIGSFSHGVLEGDSVVFDWNNDYFEGSFRNNRFAEGTYTDNTNLPKGNYFKGRFSNGQPSSGYWYNSGGKVLRKVGDGYVLK